MAKTKQVKNPAPKAPAKPKPKPLPKTSASALAKKKTTTVSRPAPKTTEPKAGSAKKKVIGSAVSLKLGLYQLGGSKSNPDPVLKAFKPTFKAVPQSLSRLNNLAALIEFEQLKKSKDYSHWGLLPNDLEQRTGLTAEELKAVILENPGYDLYYCSAHPEVEAVYHNAWRAPQVTHPSFVELSRKFLRTGGLSDAPIDSLSHSSLFATGHLMVASPIIWEKYTKFIRDVFTKAFEKVDAETMQSLFQEPAIKGKISNLELIAARLMGIFLLLESSDFKAFKIPLKKQENLLNTHLQFLREMKDYAIENRSRWHLAAWINYRGLYLAHVMGKEWIVKHIENISPKALRIAYPVAKVNNSYPRALPQSSLNKTTSQ